MKKLQCILLIIIFSALIFAAPTYSMRQYPFYAGLNAGIFRLHGNDAPGSLARISGGARFGYNYTPYFAFEISGSYGSAKPSDPEASGFTSWTSGVDMRAETKMYNLDLAMRYNLLPKLPSNPYLYIGLGNQYWQVDNKDDTTSGFAYDETYSNIYSFAGLGLENRLNDHVSLTLSYRIAYLFGDTDNILGDGSSPDQVSQFGVELSYRFGHGVIESVSLEDIEAVTFRFNSIKITPESEDVIDYVEDALNQNPNLVLEIRGFTDNTGSDSVNLRMSKRRAISVKQMLVDRGIAPTRLITTAMGHQNPVATNSTPEGRALNRRVEFYELDK